MHIAFGVMARQKPFPLGYVQFTPQDGTKWKCEVNGHTVTYDEVDATFYAEHPQTKQLLERWQRENSQQGPIVFLMILRNSNSVS